MTLITKGKHQERQKIHINRRYFKITTSINEENWPRGETNVLHRKFNGVFEVLKNTNKKRRDI